MLDREIILILARDEEFASVVDGCLKNLYSYTSFVMGLETSLVIAKTRALDIQDFQETAKNLDNRRRVEHDAAMNSLKVLNRMAQKRELTPVYAGHIYDGIRGKIANAIFAFCKETLDLDKHGDKVSAVSHNKGGAT